MGLITGFADRMVGLVSRLGRKRESPAAYQEHVLKRLLYAAADTAFGKHYHFRGVLRSTKLLETYQAIVPFHDYDSMHDQWWHRALADEPDVAWPGHIKYFALSSGTTGSPSKYIPVSKEMIRAMQRVSARCFFQMTRFGLSDDFFLKDLVLLGGSTNLVKVGNYYVGDLSGINISKTPFWLRMTSKPGKDVAALSNWNERLEEIARQAVTWDVGSISGNPAWNRLMIQKILEYHKADNIHQIWPNLQAFAHGGVAMEPYKRSFEELLGKPIYYIETYLASEGFIAYQSRLETHAMQLALNQGIFFEFIPFNETNFDADGHIIGHPKAYTIGDVQTGLDYALVMSTCAGAWRYLIGDTVRFTDVKRAEIVITGRIKHFLSICGEHLSVCNMNDAVQHLQEQLQVEIPEYTVTALPVGDGFAHHWYLGVEGVIDTAVATKIIDEYLCRTNDDYRVERSALLKTEVKGVLPSSAFYDFMESIGKIGNQHKFPRVMKGDQWQQWLRFIGA